ncbi:MAG: signal peptidase I [Candidatus Gottesmanbacteria bacterium]|nr:signal peptidase I [Candidatus Gottesmanbacteria bacterium]
MKKINWKKTGNIFYWILCIILLIFAGVVAVSTFNLPGGIKLYTVQSGSMEPSIHTGSIVISKPSDNYQKGDVITFKAEKDRTIKNPKSTTTHRIFEVKTVDGKEEYITKGDANNGPDMAPTGRDLILGKEIISVPLLGYPVAFAKTQEGLIFMIIIPATLIVYSELMNIKNEAKKLIEKRKKKKLSMKEKIEVEIGEEEIKAENWFKRLIRKMKRNT